MITNEQLQTIQKVIDRIAPKYTFGDYLVDDIKQESFIICMEAMEKYDNVRPLENFISKHLSNRLKTLKRDKYFRNNPTKSKTKVQLSKITISEEELQEKLGTKEALDIVIKNLSPSMRNDFYRLANGVSIQSHRKNSLFNRIKEILGEDW